MKSFKEFLKEQEEHLRAQEATREDTKTRWVNSLFALVEQMTTWLRESDPDRLLKLKEKVIERSEESIGTYDVPALDIRLGGKGVSVLPVALDVMGPRVKPASGTWSGRVDIVGDPSTYEIYRFTGSDDTETWHIRDTQTYELRGLTKETFDSALVELFS